MPTSFPSTASTRRFSVPPVPTDPYPAFNFLVEISGIAKGSFSEVSGLDSPIEVIEYRTGDAKENTVRKLVGLRKFSNITLKRGYTSDLSLWNWFDSVAQGNLRRAAGFITLLDVGGCPMCRFCAWGF
jgi:phage tail-like protein